MNRLSDNKLAWAITLPALILSVVGMVWIASTTYPAGASAGGPAAQLTEQQRSLIQRRIALQSRISVCERREENSTNALVCPAEEAARLPQYREEIQKIDGELRASGLNL
jgi:hypothetical protein